VFPLDCSVDGCTGVLVDAKLSEEEISEEGYSRISPEGGCPTLIADVS